MALITCPECGGQVSDKANACPHCGLPICSKQSGKRYSKAKKQPGFFILLFASALIIIICAILFFAIHKYNSTHSTAKYQISSLFSGKEESEEPTLKNVFEELNATPAPTTIELSDQSIGQYLSCTVSHKTENRKRVATVEIYPTQDVTFSNMKVALKIKFHFNYSDKPNLGRLPKTFSGALYTRTGMYEEVFIPDCYYEEGEIRVDLPSSGYYSFTITAIPWDSIGTDILVDKISIATGTGTINLKP